MTCNDGLTPLQDAFLNAQHNREAFSDLSAQDINRMDMTTFARLTGREFSFAPVTEGEAAAYPAQSAPAVPDAPQQAGLTAEQIRDMGWDEYQALRQAAGIGQGQYGRGALDGGSTADWIAAAQRQPGRSGWQGSNVVEAPRLTDRYVDQSVQLDTRSARDRLSTPGNSWQG